MTKERVTIALMVGSIIAVLAVLVVTATGASGQEPSLQEVELMGGFDSTECDRDNDGWHFNATQSHDTDLTGSFVWINHINAPDHAIPLDRRTGGVAHYLGTDHGLDAGIESATLHIAQGWDGQFVLSHRPCGNDDHPTPTPTPTETPPNEVRFKVDMTIVPSNECEVLPMVEFTVSVHGEGAVGATVIGPGSETPYHHMSSITEGNPLQSFFHPLAPGTFSLLIDGEVAERVSIKRAEPCPTRTETPSPSPTTPSPDPTPSESGSPTSSPLPSSTPTPTSSPSPTPTESQSEMPASPLPTPSLTSSPTPQPDLPRTGLDLRQWIMLAGAALTAGIVTVRGSRKFI